jgi:hypothetical protein
LVSQTQFESKYVDFVNLGVRNKNILLYFDLEEKSNCPKVALAKEIQARILQEEMSNSFKRFNVPENKSPSEVVSFK